MTKKSETTAAVVAKTIVSIDRLLELGEEKRGKLIELRDIFKLAAAVGVHPNNVRSSGFRSPTRTEYDRWSRLARATLPFYRGSTPGADACQYRGKSVVNKVALRDGREFALGEPLFLEGSPTPNLGPYGSLAAEQLRQTASLLPGADGRDQQKKLAVELREAAVALHAVESLKMGYYQPKPISPKDEARQPTTGEEKKSG